MIDVGGAADIISGGGKKSGHVEIYSVIKCLALPALTINMIYVRRDYHGGNEN